MTTAQDIPVRWEKTQTYCFVHLWNNISLRIRGKNSRAYVKGSQAIAYDVLTSRYIHVTPSRSFDNVEYPLHVPISNFKCPAWNQYLMRSWPFKSVKFLRVTMVSLVYGLPFENVHHRLEELCDVYNHIFPLGPSNFCYLWICTLSGASMIRKKYFTLTQSKTSNAIRPASCNGPEAAFPLITTSAALRSVFLALSKAGDDIFGPAVSVLVFTRFALAALLLQILTKGYSASEAKM